MQNQTQQKPKAWQVPKPIFKVGDQVISLAHDGLVMEVKPYFKVSNIGCIGTHEDGDYLSFSLQNGQSVYTDLMPAVVPNTPAYQKIKAQLVLAYKLSKLSGAMDE